MLIQIKFTMVNTLYLVFEILKLQESASYIILFLEKTSIKIWNIVLPLPANEALFFNHSIFMLLHHCTAVHTSQYCSNVCTFLQLLRSSCRTKGLVSSENAIDADLNVSVHGLDVPVEQSTRACASV